MSQGGTNKKVRDLRARMVVAVGRQDVEEAAWAQADGDVERYAILCSQTAAALCTAAPHGGAAREAAAIGDASAAIARASEAAALPNTHVPTAAVTRRLARRATTGIKCRNPACGRTDVMVDMRQTRSADEGMDAIYRCVRPPGCGMIWKGS